MLAVEPRPCCTPPWVGPALLAGRAPLPLHHPPNRPAAPTRRPAAARLPGGPASRVLHLDPLDPDQAAAEAAASAAAAPPPGQQQGRGAQAQAQAQAQALAQAQAAGEEAARELPPHTRAAVEKLVPWAGAGAPVPPQDPAVVCLFVSLPGEGQGWAGARQRWKGCVVLWRWGEGARRSSCGHSAACSPVAAWRHAWDVDSLAYGPTPTPHCRAGMGKTTLTDGLSLEDPPGADAPPAPPSGAAMDVDGAPAAPTPAAPAPLNLRVRVLNSDRMKATVQGFAANRYWHEVGMWVGTNLCWHEAGARPHTVCTCGKKGHFVCVCGGGGHTRQEAGSHELQGRGGGVCSMRGAQQRPHEGDCAGLCCKPLLARGGHVGWDHEAGGGGGRVPRVGVAHLASPAAHLDALAFEACICKTRA
jgi:hypothetical protein